MSVTLQFKRRLLARLAFRELFVHHGHELAKHVCIRRDVQVLDAVVLCDGGGEGEEMRQRGRKCDWTSLPERIGISSD